MKENVYLITLRSRRIDGLLSTNETSWENEMQHCTIELALKRLFCPRPARQELTKKLLDVDLRVFPIDFNS